MLFPRSVFVRTRLSTAGIGASRARVTLLFSLTALALGGCGAAHDEQQRANRADRHGEAPRALTAAADHALESQRLLAGQVAAAVLGKRGGRKHLGPIGHAVIVRQTPGGHNGRTVGTFRSTRASSERWARRRSGIMDLHLRSAS